MFSVVIPESVTEIEYEAFRECEKLKSVVIPESVETIGSSAFQYCKGLESVTIGNNHKSFGHCQARQYLDFEKKNISQNTPYTQFFYHCSGKGDDKVL